MTESVEALVLLEVEGIAACVRAHDEALKRAPITVLACAPVTPGKALLVFSGDVASAEESLTVAVRLLGARCIDRLFLPAVAPAVVEAMRGGRRARNREALAVLEIETAAGTVVAADTAVKAASVEIGHLHLASGYGGHGFFSLWGGQSDVEAAVAAAEEIANGGLRDHEIIPAPHDDLEATIFSRPWPLDPARSL